MLAEEPIDFEVFDLFPFALGRDGPLLLRQPALDSGLGKVYMIASIEC